MPEKKIGMLEFIKFGIKNFNYLRATRAKDPIRATITLANMELGKMGYGHPLYVQRVQEFNQGMIELYKGKWYATRGMRTRSKEDWKLCFEGFKNADRIGKMLLRYLRDGSDKPVEYRPSTIESNEGAEAKFADGVPLVPEITPIILIKGSDFEMGYQYARQLTQVFGKWMLENNAGKKFSGPELETMRAWEEQHRKYTPWLIDFCKGWAAAANDLGIKTSYEDVLDLWVGHKPPVSDFLGSEGGMPELPPMACSGVAAWGRATKDGKLVTASTGDHDMGYQVTVVAFPDHGNSFIYSPFGATGSIGTAGAIWFFGHPAINDKGLAYVHHGGGPKFLEPKEYWGYGLRRAASVMHILRFADTAREARQMEEAWPIGDIGNGDQATVGGFYADGSYAYIIEGRREPVAIREAGVLGETDFIYANNSAAHPAAIQAGWMNKDKEEWMWEKRGGWRPKTPVGMTKSMGLLFAWLSGRMNASDVMRKGLMFAYTNSSERNKYLFGMMTEGLGKIDIEYMKMVYRNGGTIPDGPWNKLIKDYNASGKWGRVSTGHASNAMTVVTKPNEGLYCMCAGPAKRGLVPMMPSNALSIYNETNAFWEIRLAQSPAEVVEYAGRKAEEYIKSAREELSRLDTTSPAYEPLKGLLSLAEQEFEGGAKIDVHGPNSKEYIYDLSRSIRAYTRAQVRALQVYQALVPPRDRP